MKCRICKRGISRNASHFYVLKRTRSGFIRIRWCRDCDTNQPAAVDRLHLTTGVFHEVIEERSPCIEGSRRAELPDATVPPAERTTNELDRTHRSRCAAFRQ